MSEAFRSSDVEKGSSLSDLPLLEYCKNFAGFCDLSDVCVLGVQHILGTTHSMVRSLYEYGLQPTNVAFLGKCYSTNEDVLEELREDGVRVSDLSLRFDTSVGFDDQHKENISLFLKECQEIFDFSQYKKIILIDDGGTLIELAHQFFDLDARFSGIEQTSSGYQKLLSIDLKIPVINVARSDTKLVYESPYIAQSILLSTLNKCSNYDSPTSSRKKVLILGGGSIGRAIRDQLSSNVACDVFDKNQQHSNIAQPPRLGDYDIIFGCTGGTSLPASLHSQLKQGVILASASSSDREFDAASFRGHSNELLRDCHADIEIGGGIVLLNSGFPVNFTGERHSVPAFHIQLTRALLLLAILQVCQLDQEIAPGLHVLNTFHQQLLVQEFLRITSFDLLWQKRLGEVRALLSRTFGRATLPGMHLEKYAIDVRTPTKSKLAGRTKQTVCDSNLALTETRFRPS